MTISKRQCTWYVHRSSSLTPFWWAIWSAVARILHYRLHPPLLASVIETVYATITCRGVAAAASQHQRLSPIQNKIKKQQQQQQQRQRGSYATATASSKARGGPTSSAPRAKPASEMKATIRPIPKLSVPTNKENEANSASGSAASAGGTTPVKKQPPSSTAGTSASATAIQENGDDVILSPTPYYKVLEQRGGKTSPRLTRSAVKRAQTKRAMDSLAMLDVDDDSDDGDGEETKTPLPHGDGGVGGAAAAAAAGGGGGGGGG